MINLLIGLVVIVLFLVFIYLLGIIPNLWSNCTVNPKEIFTAIEEGFGNFWKLFVFCIILVCIYGLGLFIKDLIK